MPKEAASTRYSENTCDSAALMKATSGPNSLPWAGSASHVAPLESGASRIMPAHALQCHRSALHTPMTPEPLILSVGRKHCKEQDKVLGQSSRFL
jgi:hypothetical protein